MMAADSPPRGIRDRACDALARAVTRGRWVVLAIAAVAACAGGWLAASRLRLDADTNSLIDPSRPFMQRYREFLDRFGDLEHVYVAIAFPEGASDAAAAAADELGPELSALPDVREVHWRIDASEQWRLAPRAMETAQLRGLADASGALPVLAAAPGAAALLSASDAMLERLAASGMSMDAQERQRLGAAAILLARSAIPGDDQGLGRPVATQHLRTDGRMLLLTVALSKDFTSLSTIEAALSSVRKAIAAVAPRHPAVEIGLTGKPVLQADELATTNSDMTRGSAIATAVIALLAAIVFRSAIRPALAVVAFAAAFAWTYGLTTLLVGHLTLLSLVFMLVLVGAGLDYGIHLLSRYGELRRHLDTERAIAAMLRTTAVPTWTGAITSAGTFLLALLTDFGGLRELGIIAGVGLLMCALSMTVVLPALLAVAEGRPTRRGAQPAARTPAERVPPDPGLAPEPLHRRPWRGRAGWIVAASACALLVLAALIPSTRIESNLLKLQAEGLPSVDWERRLMADSISASWFAASMQPSAEAALLLADRARKEPLVAQVRSAFDLVRPDDPERLSLRERIAHAGDGMVPASTAAEPLTPSIVSSVADRAGRLASLARLGGAEAAQSAAQTLDPLVKSLRALEARLRDPAAAGAAQADAAAAAQRATEAAQALMAGAAAPLREALPAAVRANFVAPDGTFCVMLFPAGDVWEWDPMQSFVAAVRALDPTATGVPMTQFESMVDMRSAFLVMSWGSLLLVAVVVWLDLRSVRATLACLAALCLGMAWTFGAMALFGVPLNLANFFGVPMLIGFGIDSAVHIVHRARETGHARDLGATRRAVTLAAATTAIGFGTLCVAQHQGLQSLGWLMVIGSACCLAAAVWTLPAILEAYPPAAGIRRRHRLPAVTSGE